MTHIHVSVRLRSFLVASGGIARDVVPSEPSSLPSAPIVPPLSTKPLQIADLPLLSDVPILNPQEESGSGSGSEGSMVHRIQGDRLPPASVPASSNDAVAQSHRDEEEDDYILEYFDPPDPAHGQPEDRASTDSESEVGFLPCCGI